MNNHIIFVIIIILLVILSLFIYKKIEKFRTNNIKVLLFYTNWCKYSQKMLPEWEKTIKGFNSKPIDFIKYDCDELPDKCKQYEIKYLPTIYVIKNGKKFKYTDDIDYNQLGTFIYKYLD